MRILKWGAVIVGVVTLGGCNFHTTMPTSDPALNAEADALFEDLVLGRDDALIARMSSANKAEEIRAQLPMLRNMVGEATPPEPTVAGTRKTSGTSGEIYEVQQDYAYPDRVVHAYTTLVKEGGAWKVQGFNVNAQMKPLSAEPST
ncbi:MULTISPECIES: hypothetical protein [unclassified Brevundimonas]|uniref:hypothetical protein n=1 Tax=unclassified Brevundimonas TaxID=2622653 RepID=UPI000CFADFC5|nr:MULTISPECIES: hypothetical protein [unclassified Brevundimonas]PRA34484.1 hypothetical protein CQ024_03770 [Brevundimonas sp. MYb27]PQZ84185.1 hypothetical protein CQ026_02705 [Brevundimonas sp. MYb31]PRB17842.1 hypothetical protein CQ039_02090 [Brevundimonas sp. MYb52]PRB38213.1 hypothetical protein CQ035_02090 [Brevundimonas sp. MYb46]PRB56006.1 hypothetical protein CQ028_00845 [Brevundimonas sp. MYb33]